jgi:hypothetical protein
MVKLLYSHISFYKTLVGVLCLVLAGFSSFAQTDNTEVILKKLTEYKEQVLHEKIFVHTDRTSYVAGEIIWFKVYCTEAANNHLLEVSKVAYVEVLDKDQQPVLQGKIALAGGTGSGSFVIPLNMRSGNFILRSYTNWMKNFDPEFYFHQNLTIINTLKAETITTDKVIDTYNAQFFPEGGNLVNGLKSKVAFQVTDNTGKGADFNGILVDQDNDTIVHFKPAKFGIGNFSFMPQKGRKYKAVVTTKGRTVTTQNLPAPLSSGFVLNIPDATPGNTLKINVSTTTGDRSGFLVIHQNQVVKTSALVRFENGNADFQVDKSSLGDGISYITLFDQNNHPVCERLYFKRPQQQLIIDAGASQQQFASRKKVTISVLSKDEGANAEPSEMSVSVFLLDSLQFRQQNIQTYLWMSSDLKGIVESPESYLDNTGVEAEAAVDNLMLTHGWRKFKWEDVLASKKPLYTFLPEYEGHLVGGKIINKYTNLPGRNVPGFLSVPGPLFHLYTALSKSDGSIYFNTSNFFGSGLIVGQTNKLSSDSFRLDISNPFSEEYSSVKAPSFNPLQISPRHLLNKSIQMQVQNVYNGEKLNRLLAPQVDTFNFYGKPGFKYMLEDYTRFPTMEEVLREYVREVNVRKRRDNFILTTVTKDELGNAIIKEPVVLLDGVPQFDNGNKITHYDPLKVQKLEGVQERYFLGPVSFDGVASFSTYNGDLEGFRLDTTSTVLDYDALQLKREFYSPAYLTSQDYSGRLPDFRSLLYWSPDIKTDNTGKKEITFYTSDLTGRYAVFLQGISKSGKPGSKVFTIDVTK